MKTLYVDSFIFRMANHIEKRPRGPVGDWYKDANNIKGILMDIYGVLYDCDIPVPGSVDAIARLKASGIPVRFCSNTSTRSIASLAAKLQNMGFQISENEIFTPAPLAVKYVQEKGLRPFLLVKDTLLSEFEGVDQSDPNCVLIGDATDKFTYESLNKAFHILLKSEKHVLLSMGKGKYYSHNNGGMKLDVGPYMKALEYACDCEAYVIGKPSASYFLAALEDMGLSPNEVVMIGDDINYDAGGAQKVGMKGVQVRTGKYRKTDEPHPVVCPDGYVDDLAQAVDLFLKHR